MIIRINASRLQSDLEALGRIGRDAAGGITRPSFSRADLEARVWLQSRIEEAGLEYREDGAGNQFGRLEGASGPEASVVMAGSHLDTVPNGGMFDGAAGVVAALECLRTIREEGLRLRLPLEAASFTDEEGNLVGDFLGSRAFTGKLDRELLERGTTSFGPPLADILAATPYTIETVLSAAGQAPAVAAYLGTSISNRGRSWKRRICWVSSRPSAEETLPVVRLRGIGTLRNRSPWRCGATPSSGWPTSPCGRRGASASAHWKLRHHRKGPHQPGTFGNHPRRAGFS